MDYQNRENLINRIISDLDIFYHNNTKYYLCTPSKEIRALSYHIYDEFYNDNLFAEWLSEEEAAMKIRILNGNKDLKEVIKNLNESIDNYKLNLFREFFVDKKRQKLKKDLVLIKNKLGHFLNIQHSLDYLTLNGYATMIKTQFLAAMSICTLEKKPIFHPDDFLTIDYSLVDKVIRHWNENRITHEEFRELARTEPWRSYSSARKEDAFGVAPIDLNDEQRTLLLYTKMYEGVYNHPECPSDELIEDDDALDGWMIDNKKRVEREKNQRAIDKKLGDKHKDATEVFLPAESKEQIKKIEELNDTQAKMTKMQRNALLKQKGKVKEADMPDVKQELQMKSQQMVTQAAKRK